MNSVPTDFSSFSKHGTDYYLVKLWILIYNDGCLCSFNRHMIVDNMVMALECGQTPYMTSKELIVSYNQLPHVFKSCFNRERELQCVQQKE